jgi:hypothetical protein
VCDLPQWRCVEVVELVPTLPACCHETGGLEDVNVLRDRLSGRTHAVLGREPGAEFEQGLSVSFRELVEDGPACGIGECLEHVSHNSTIGKQRLACQRRLAPLVERHSDGLGGVLRPMVALELHGLDLAAGHVEDCAVHSQRLVGFVSAA